MQRALTHTAASAVLILSAVTAYACKENDDSPTGPNDVTTTVIGSIHYDTQIVGLLHEANVGEIVAGQVAAERATDGEVKSFATSMVSGHTTLDTENSILEAQLGLTPELPDAALPQRQSAEVSQLSGISGPAFDRAYIAQQITAHQRTLAIVDASIAKTKTPALRTMLENDVRPHIVQHLVSAQQIRARTGNP